MLLAKPALHAFTAADKHKIVATHRPVLTVTEAKVILFDVWADSYDNLHITPTSFLPKNINRKHRKTEGEDLILVFSHKKYKNKENFGSLSLLSTCGLVMK